jgi:hypothetical protein
MLTPGNPREWHGSPKALLLALQAGRMLELAWLPLAWPLGSGAVLATATEEGSLSLINVAQVGACLRCYPEC